MYLGREKGMFAPARAPGDAPPREERPVDWVRFRPLLPRYRLAGGIYEIAELWGVAELHQAHLLCDAIDEAQAEE